MDAIFSAALPEEVRGTYLGAIVVGRTNRTENESGSFLISVV